MALSFNQHVDVESNQTLTIDFLGLVKRQGMDSLINYLQNSNYFTSPASTRYHNVFEGGLCQHSLNVTREFSAENTKWQKPLPQDSVILCGLLHDLCKVGAYIETDKGYESVKGPKGHATRSISKIKEYIELTPREDDIIRFHMGTFGIYSYREHTVFALHQAVVRTPLCQIFAAIDQADSKRKTDATQSRRV